MSLVTVVHQDGTTAGTCTQAEAREGEVADFDIFGECCYALYSKRSGLVKLGRTLTLLSRWRSLETGCGMPLELLVVWKTPESKTLESRIHSKFAASRTIGEWFESAGVIGHLLDPHLLDGITHQIPAPLHVAVSNGKFEFLTTAEVSTRLGVSRQTLSTWRANNMGPVSEKIMGNLRYPRVEFEQWLAAECARTGRGDAAKVSA